MKMSAFSPFESDMLDWVGTYVTEINSLTHKGRGSKVEIVCADEDRMIIVRRCGKTDAAAFRKCVEAGMRQWPLPGKVSEQKKAKTAQVL